MPDDLRSRLLNLLAREFEYTQALHSEKEDIARKLDLGDLDALDDTLRSLEQDGLVNLWVDPRGRIKLAKITWRGLNEIGDVKLHYGLDRSSMER
ncbi:MAG: hypothetical protein ACE5H4_03900 [Candidatus Thorarchaeota archaeon]